MAFFNLRNTIVPDYDYDRRSLGREDTTLTWIVLNTGSSILFIFLSFALLFFLFRTLLKRSPIPEFLTEITEGIRSKKRSRIILYYALFFLLRFLLSALSIFGLDLNPRLKTVTFALLYLILFFVSAFYRFYDSKF